MDGAGSALARRPPPTGGGSIRVSPSDFVPPRGPFGGVFPNRLHDCDVLRYQYLDRSRLDISDVALASDHGRELLDSITA